MHKTTFAGLTELDPNDQLTVDGASFTEQNPSRTDYFLKIGAVTHKHDNHAQLHDPTQQIASAYVLASGGQVPGSVTLFAGYTLIDSYGGETRLSQAVSVSTPAQPAGPSGAIAAVFDPSAGGMPVGQFGYALSLNDSSGGETVLGPAVFVQRPAGYASGQILLSGLAQELTAQFTSWNLWRLQDGSAFQIVATGTANTFTDTGLICTDAARSPQLDNTHVLATNTVLFKLPTAASDPPIASAASMRIYLSPDGSFASPCLYTTVPTASAGQTLVVRQLTLSAGSPPAVSLASRGASQIDPDTDLLDWHWKRPVPTYGMLPAGVQGDVRVTIDTRALWFVGAASAAGPVDWSPMFGAGTAVQVEGTGPYSDIEFVGGSGATLSVENLGGGSAKVSIGTTGDIDLPAVNVQASGGPLLTPTDIVFVASGGASISVTDMGGGSAKVSIAAPSASQGPQGIQGIQGVAGASGAPGAAGAAGASGAPGATGPAGASGAVGATGATGPPGASGANGAAGPAGASGANGAAGATGPQGIPGTAVTAVEDGVTRVTPTADITFIGATVTDLGGGSARVSISAAGGGGSTIAVEGAGGSPRITPVRDIRVIASGGASAGITDMGGGSAQISISTTPTPCFVVNDTAGGSAMAGGANATPIEFVGSGVASATVSKSGGSAIVTITVAPVAGPQGIQGIQGVAGAVGASGAPGATGPAGASGAQGIQGPAGASAAGGGGGFYVGSAYAASGVSSAPLVGPATAIVFAPSADMQATPSISGGSAIVTLTHSPRSDVNYTMGSALVANASAAADIPLGKSFVIFQVTTDDSVRIRLYTTPAKRDADVARAVGVDPPPNSGLILELVTSSSNLSYHLSPMVTGADLRSPLIGVTAASITNLGATGTRTLTFKRLLLEG